ncbi:hypothetical protein J6590_011758 [Homalodisca vitripennis]|nr:hypothetical protein J6590_011758 [Homalodisca vitripennis]
MIPWLDRLRLPCQTQTKKTLLNTINTEDGEGYRESIKQHPYLSNNVKSRLFVAAREMCQLDRKFQSFYRMTKDSFLELTRLVGPSLEKLDTTMGECVPAQERLMITLR